MKKVLIVIQFLRRGGVELAALNFAENMDKNNFNITICLVNPYEQNNISIANELERELTNLNIKIIKIPNNVKSYASRYLFLKKLMSEEKYDIVHSHVLLFSGIVLTAAKNAGVCKRIAHSHISRWNHKENIKYKIYKRCMQFLLHKNATDILACSSASGNFLYGKKYFSKHGKIINNGIDVNKFSYNEGYRKEIRKEFSVDENDILIGHIGSIYRIKNQIFILKVLKELVDNNYFNFKVILVGEIIDTDEIVKFILENNLSDFVIMIGQRTDVYKFYSAFDVMVFPSLFEAMPLSLIEAQCSQLNCVVSDTITNEVKYNENLSFLSLNADLQIWCDKIFELLKIQRNSVDNKLLIENNDINYVCKKLEEIYLN